MNLLEATTTLIDVARTYAPDDDRIVARAIKRMEKRLFVLQVRQAKARKRNRVKAFWDAIGYFNGGVCTQSRKACFLCPACGLNLYFGDFIKNAEFSKGGRFLSMSCPHCVCVTDRVVGSIMEGAE
jgi:hypothetical protein